MIVIKLPHWDCRFVPLCQKPCGFSFFRGRRENWRKTKGAEKKYIYSGILFPEVWLRIYLKCENIFMEACSRKTYKWDFLAWWEEFYQPSCVTHMVFFFRWNWKSAAALSASIQLNRLLGLCFAAGLERSTCTFLTLAIHCWRYMLAQRRVPLFRYSSTGHLLRQVAR